MAHIPDGFLSPPVLAGTAVLSAAMLAVAARRSGARLGDRQAPLLGAMTAFVFAAQMLNFPLGAGASAHLLGGVLVAVVAGPWVAMLALFSVVLVQALLFQDGGVAALGANALNVAILGAGGGYIVYRWILTIVGRGARRRIAAAGLAGFASAAMTGAAVALELGLSGIVPFEAALTVVGGAHLLVGLGEGILTAAILAAVARARPELLSDGPPPATGRRLVLAVTTAAVALTATATLAASRRPDALESALSRLGLNGRPGWLASTGLPAESGTGGALVPALAGVGVVLGLGWFVFRLSARGRGP